MPLELIHKMRNSVNHIQTPAGKIIINKRRASYIGIILVLITFFYLLLNLGELPDYESYERIFTDAVLGGDWEILFVALAYLFTHIGLSYSDFRDFILVTSSLSLLLTLRAIDRQRLGAARFANDVIFYHLFLTFVLLVFFLEYFVIRIRAGLAIGVISLAFYFFLSGGRMGRLAAVVLVVLSFFVHQFTSIILAILVIFPIAWSSMPKFFLRKKSLFYLVSAFVACMVLFGIQTTFESRGENVFSSLNSVRFLAISVIPLIIYFLIPGETRIYATGGEGYYNVEFVRNFVRLYVIFSAALFVSYFLGLTENSGEAIVRVFTLASLPALYSLVFIGSVRKAPISSYILATNALFFIATIYFPSNG